MLLLRAATPLFYARLWWRGRREAAYRQFWGERLGHAARGTPTGRLWLHAVSLGETHAAAPLIAALRAQRPGLRLLLTHGTATGREAGARLLQPGDAQAWLPYDTPGAVRRFLQAHQPAAGVLMETEVWPALLAEAEAAAVPLVLANARLSARSAAKGWRLRVLLHPALARFTRVLAQTEADAERFRAAGARGVAVMGNLKFDLTPDEGLLARGGQWRGEIDRPVVLAASTREGEEAPLLRAWARLPAPRPLLLLVPRHPQRFDEVAARVTEAGFTLQRRSSWATRPPGEAAAAEVWLGDSLGEMALYYAAADVALLGGSFAPLGGQNLIEAAACGCPLLMGPHTFNFALAAELSLAAGAAERVADVDAAVQRAAVLALDAVAKAAMAAAARDFAAQHRGAAARMAQAVLALLPVAAQRLTSPADG
ncbi:MAG: 3-deoxy-D-manno-octulosonic acid transferase [Rubrivivax sp.]|nr:3-deoxy-D-manno-octulosonic acid transferase [Rubrivivax sp.]